MVGKNNNEDINNISNNGSSNCPKNPLVDFFFSIPPVEFSLLASLIGILLLKYLNYDQQNSLGNFLVNVGTNMLTAAAQGQLQENESSQDDQLQDKIEELKKQISLLEKEIKK